MLGIVSANAFDRLLWVFCVLAAAASLTAFDALSAYDKPFSCVTMLARLAREIALQTLRLCILAGYNPISHFEPYSFAWLEADDTLPGSSALSFYTTTGSA